MKTASIGAAIGLALATAANAQTAPPDPNIRALQATNSELMQAWVGARSQMIHMQDELAIAQQKLEELQTKIPRQGDEPMHKAPVAANPTEEKKP